MFQSPVVQDVVRVGEDGRELKVVARLEKRQSERRWYAHVVFIRRRQRVDVEMHEPSQHVMSASQEELGRRQVFRR